MVDLESRELLVHGRVAAGLGDRAFEILVLLIESRGALVSKEDIMRSVWPGIFVGHNALEFHISALRKALGSERGLLKTAYGRGYRALGEWRFADDAPASGSGALRPPVSTAALLNLPLPTSRLIGRDVAISAVAALLAGYRLVSLVGSGGIGKTRLAIEVARRSVGEYPDGVWLVELGLLSDATMVSAVTATALGIDTANRDPLTTIAQALSEKRMLLVLDNCEHVANAAAQLAETLLRRVEGVRVLATSREPLRADGEHLYFVEPLAVPAEHAATSDITQLSSVQLFLARATAVMPDFPQDLRTFELVGVACRRLDGIPLALELAASRAATLGMAALIARLEDRFRLLVQGRRTALPQHQTLQATLDWSYDLLPEDEKSVLRRLAVFAGTFDIDAATCVAASDNFPADVIVSALSELVSKSLIVAQAKSPGAYRFLETTRAYALEKLGLGPERERAAHLHAVYHRDLFEQADAEWGIGPVSDWVTAYAPSIDDLNAALAWSFSPAGDIGLGAELSLFSAPLWLQLSLISSGLAWFERGYAALAQHEDLPQARMHLSAAVGWLGMYDPARVDQRVAAWTTAFELAQDLGDSALEMRALYALYGNRIGNGEFRAAFPIAQMFQKAAVRSGDSHDIAHAERCVAMLMHLQGRHGEARGLLEELKKSPEYQPTGPRLLRYHYDYRATLHTTLGKLYWVLGFPDKALEDCESSIARAIAIDHVPSLCTLLSDSALPIAYWCGNYSAAERHAAMLRARTAGDDGILWRGYAECFEGAVTARSGSVSEGLSKIRDGIARRRSPGMRRDLVSLLGVLGDTCLQNGCVEDGFAAIDEALTRGEETGAKWCMPELLRIKGDLLALRDVSDVAALEFLQHAITLARSHGALAWELRAATSLARLQLKLGRGAAARSILEPVFYQFTEGFRSLDLMEASQLLAILE